LLQDAAAVAGSSAAGRVAVCPAVQLAVASPERSTTRHVVAIAVTCCYCSPSWFPRWTEISLPCALLPELALVLLDVVTLLLLHGGVPVADTVGAEVALLLLDVWCPS